MSMVGNSARDDRLRKSRSRCDPNTLIVEKRALALERHRNCEVRNTVQEIGGAIERIDDPHVALVSALAPATFLAEKTISWPCLHEFCVDGFFGATVCGRYKIGRALQ